MEDFKTTQKTVFEVISEYTEVVKRSWESNELTKGIPFDEEMFQKNVFGFFKAQQAGGTPPTCMELLQADPMFFEAWEVAHEMYETWRIFIETEPLLKKAWAANTWNPTLAAEIQRIYLEKTSEFEGGEF